MSSLRPEDEFRHRPDGSPTWQENFVFHAFDTSSRSGWYLHLGYIDREGLLDVRALVIIDGQVVSTTVQTAGIDCLQAPGLSVDVEVPFERLRLRYDSKGHRGSGELGWFGSRGGDVPFGFEVSLVSGHPAVFFGEHVASAGLDPRMAGNHYELAAHWEGRIWSGNESVSASGLLVRDHSWGPREWHFDQVCWMPMVFDEGSRLVSTLSVLTAGTWRGFSIDTAADGTRNVCTDPWIRVGGAHWWPRAFQHAELLRTGERAEKHHFHGQIHLPLQRHASFTDDSAAARGLSDMYATVTGPAGQGFGTLQFATTAPDVLQGLAVAPA